MRSYYERLGVLTCASNDDIRRAYRALALSAHPDKGGSRSEWGSIQEAYETLSSPEKRCLYDFMGAFAHLPERNWSQPCPQATTGDSYSAQPASRCGSASSVSSLDSYTSLENAGMATTGLLGKRPAPSHARNQQPGPGGPPCVDADVLVQLRLTLEELFTGCTKQLRLKRKLFLQVPGLGHDVATGSWAETEELFRIVVSPGAREGTRFSFAGKGNLLPGAAAAGSMVIVLHQQPHHHYTRRGSHLHVTCAVPLLTCLSGGSACISTLDGRTLLVPLGPNCLQPAAEHVIRGEGMPLPNAGHSASGLGLALKAPSDQAAQQQQQRRQLRAVRFPSPSYQQQQQASTSVGCGSKQSSDRTVLAADAGGRGDLHIHFQVLV